MRVFISLARDSVVVAQARADRPSGLMGDMLLEIAPGQTVAGVPYEVWRSHAGKAADLKDLLQEEESVPHG